MLDVAELQRELAGRGTSWRATPTRLSALDPVRRRMLAGALEVPLAQALELASSGTVSSRPSIEAPPARVDWRDHDGNWVTPVRDQDLCSSCVAFAICAVMESRLRIDADNSSLDVVLAPGPLFFRDHPRGCEVGRYASDLVAAARHGVGLERDAPYSIGGQVLGAVPPFAKVTGSRHGIGDARARKFFILDEGPVYAEMRLYEDVYAHAGGVYRHVQGSDDGLHGVVVVGYVDEQSCWIVKNSWGTGYHEDGFLRIAYGECEIDTRPFIALDVERITDAPP